ncbi:MAG: hypothetical protein KC431_32045, partial [Myxococcales bacterium]|nr:hypothetical protein [Myxococcales bacterium]
MTDPKSAEQIWPMLQDRLDWGTRFQLIILFTEDDAAAEALWRKLAAGALGESARRLRCIEVDALRGTLATVEASLPSGGDILWIEALADEQPWLDAWRTLTQALNERREPLREGLCGLFLVAGPAAKAVIQAAGPDLWSIRSATYDLGPGPGPELSDIERARELSIELRRLIRVGPAEPASWNRAAATSEASAETIEGVMGPDEDSGLVRGDLLATWLELAALAREVEDPALARTCLERIVAVAERAGAARDTMVLAQAHAKLAAMAIDDGELDAAEAALTRSRSDLQRAMRGQASPLDRELELLAARLEHRRGQLAAARKRYAALLDRGREPDLLAEQADVLGALGD